MRSPEQHCKNPLKCTFSLQILAYGDLVDLSSTLEKSIFLDVLKSFEFFSFWKYAHLDVLKSFKNVLEFQVSCCLEVIWFFLEIIVWGASDILRNILSQYPVPKFIWNIIWKFTFEKPWMFFEILFKNERFRSFGWPSKYSLKNPVSWVSDVLWNIP